MMETTASPSLVKPRLLQDLWSELATAALLLSEVTWAAVAFCTLFNYPLGYLRIGTWFALLSFFTYLSARVMTTFAARRWLLPVFSALWLLISLLLFLKFVTYAGTALNLWRMFLDPFVNLSRQSTLQSQLWQMLFLVVLLRRAFTLAGSNANAWRAVRSFQLGMLVFLFFGFTTTWENFTLNLAPFLFYLVCVLTAMTTARLATLNGQLNYRVPVFTKTWLGWILALTAALILAGSLVGWLMGFALVEFTDVLLRILYAIGATILVILFSPLIALIGLFLPWLDKWFSSLNLENLGLQQLVFLQQLNQVDPEKAAAFNNTVNQVITILLIAVLLITTVIVIISVRRRVLKNRTTGRDDQTERAAARKLARAPGFKPGFLRSRLEEARRWLAAARIRRIYQQLMTYCAKLDNPRLPAFTPLEFLPQLKTLFPGYEEQVSLLTRVYQRVRYGEIPESIEELQTIVSAWNAVKADAEIRVKERRKRLKQH
jgi:hypothetical protein